MDDKWKPSAITKPKIVIGEGNAEEKLCAALVKAFQIPDVQVVDGKGNKAFDEVLTAYAPQIDKIGVTVVALVLDNDDSPDTTLGQVQTQIASVVGLSLPEPLDTWVVEPGAPSLAVVDLPSKGTKGTVETMIWPALAHHYKPEDQYVTELTAKVRTGQSDKLTTREKARLSAMLASTCEPDPSCMVHWMWQSEKGYAPLLQHQTFSPLVNFLLAL